jgi:predicted anti-sigma-YlaC factor YlaD
MIEHVTEWLGAYLDGELHGWRLQQVETHLKGCNDCQAELESLQSLSGILMQSPIEGDFLPPDRFASQVMFRLPRRSEAPAGKSILKIGWWLAPFGVLATWAFIQSVIVVSWLVQAANLADLLGNLPAWLTPNLQISVWSVLANDLLSGMMSETGRSLLHLLEQGEAFGANILLFIVPQVVLGLLYLSWLAAWWVRRQHS